MRRVWRWLVPPVLLLGAVVVWAVVTKPPAQSADMASLLPQGALLYIQSPNFHSLLADWNNSPEKRAWLKSDNYAVFSRSRLFSRLAQAQREFSVAATIPAGSALLNSVAGKQSCLALYDIGKLEFVYVTRMNQAALESTPLWQTRGKFEQRSEAGSTFFVRQDPQSKRVAAFAAKDGWLILGTREDLVAGVLDRLQAAGRRSLSDEAWYADAVHNAAGKPGDLRMVLNLTKIVPSPYFRSYWVQQNITQMKQYAAAVSDLYRGPKVWREDRVLLRKQSTAGAPTENVAALSALAPAGVAFWSAQASPHAASVLTTLQDDLLDPQPAKMAYTSYAPPLAQVTAAGSDSDFETRIDKAPAVQVQTHPWKALRSLIETARPRGFLQVYTTGAARSQFVSIGRAMVVEAAQDWQSGPVEKALTAALGSEVTAGDIGAGWEQRSGEAGKYLSLNGQVALFAAVHGKYLFLANDAGLLQQLLANAKKTQASGGGNGENAVTYAAVFEHSARQQDNFRSLTGMLDQAGNRGSQDNGQPPQRGQTPAFFSGNLASFGRVFAAVSRESIEQRDRGAAVTQSVRYVWSQ